LACKYLYPAVLFTRSTEQTRLIRFTGPGRPNDRFLLPMPAIYPFQLLVHASCREWKRTVHPMSETGLCPTPGKTCFLRSGLTIARKSRKYPLRSNYLPYGGPSHPAAILTGSCKRPCRPAIACYCALAFKGKFQKLSKALRHQGQKLHSALPFPGSITPQGFHSIFSDFVALFKPCPLSRIRASRPIIPERRAPVICRLKASRLFADQRMQAKRLIPEYAVENSGHVAELKLWIHH
jgi:hypothetical protein